MKTQSCSKCNTYSFSKFFKKNCGLLRIYELLCVIFVLPLFSIRFKLYLCLFFILGGIKKKKCSGTVCQGPSRRNPQFMDNAGCFAFPYW